MLYLILFQQNCLKSTNLSANGGACLQTQCSKEVAEGGLRVQGQLWLYWELEINLDYQSLCLKSKFHTKTPNCQSVYHQVLSYVLRVYASQA